MEARATVPLTPATEDERLLILAAEPPAPLFGILRNADAMTPLVVLLACLPTLWALQNAPLSTNSAMWGLRAAQLLAAEGPMEFLELDAHDPQAPLRFHPPLMTWLTALALWITPAMTSNGLLLAPWLCTAAMIGMAFLLARRLESARLGLLTVVLLAFSGPTLRLAQEPIPHSAGLFFALVCLWGIYSHWEENAGIASMKLLISGIGLGCCALASGPLALVVLLVLVLHALLMRLTRVKNSSDSPQRTRFISAAFTDVSGRSLIILAMTGFAVGGWWGALMTSEYGQPFVIVWLSNLPVSLFAGVRGEFVQTLSIDPLPLPHNLPSLLPFTLGLAFFGLWDLLRTDFWSADEDERRPASLLVSWLTVALVLALLSARPDAADPFTRSLWRLFLSIPILLLVGRGILAIADRRIRLVPVLGLLLFSLALVGWRFQHRWPPMSEGGLPALLLIAGGIVLVVACWKLYRVWPLSDRRQRWVMTAALLALLGGRCVMGLANVPRGGLDEFELNVLRRSLAQVEDVTDVVFISPHEAPPQLLFIQRRLWPDLPMSEMRGWDVALAELNTRRKQQGHTGNQVVISWDLLETKRTGTTAEAVTIAPLGTSRVFHGRELTAHVVSPRNP